MLQKLFNSIKECQGYGGVWCKGAQCLVMGVLKEIMISSLKSFVIASLSLKYKDVL
jgi:hypothetical protein